MRVTIVPEDSCVIVDGDALSGLALPASPNIHAIQWHTNFGIIEKKTGPAERFTDEGVLAPYLAVWQARRDEIDNAEPPPPPPTPVPTVTPWQICRALNETGLRTAVEAAVAGADQNTKDAWNRATSFRRDNPLIASIATALGKSSADIDALFALAQTFSLDSPT